MKQVLLTALITLSFIPIYAQTIMRQRSTAEGLSIGLYGQSTGWATSSEDISYLAENSAGFGGGVRVGYGITQRIEPFLQYDYSTLKEPKYPDFKINMSHLDLGLRFNFGSTTSRLRPFVEVLGSSVRAVANPLTDNAGNRYTMTLKGYGAAGGAGLSFFFSPAIAINVRYDQVFVGAFGKTADLTGGPLTSLTFTKAPLISTARFSAGITYYLKGRR